MIVIVFLGCHPLVAVNNLVYLPGDRSDCDEFLSSRHIVVSNFTRITNISVLICILCILYVAIANYILSKEFGFMKFYVSYSLFRKIT